MRHQRQPQRLKMNKAILKTITKQKRRNINIQPNVTGLKKSHNSSLENGQNFNRARSHFSIVVIVCYFNNVNKSDNANMKQALETQQKEKGTNKKSHTNDGKCEYSCKICRFD